MRSSTILAGAAAAIIGSQPVLACSLVVESWQLPDPPLTTPVQTPPKLPDLKVDRVSRGHAGGTSCDDLGSINFAAPADSELVSLYFTAEIISSTIPDAHMISPIYTERIIPLSYYLQGDRLMMPLIWLDGANDKQEPIEITLRITAYRRSGLKGESREFTVVDPGR